MKKTVIKTFLRYVCVTSMYMCVQNDNDTALLYRYAMLLFLSWNFTNLSNPNFALSTAGFSPIKGNFFRKVFNRLVILVKDKQVKQSKP